MGVFRIEVPKSLDVLDAEVDAYLSRMCQFERIERTTGSVEYRAKDKHGYLLSVILRKVGNETTGLHVINPPPEAEERAMPILQTLLFHTGIIPNPARVNLDLFVYEAELPAAEGVGRKLGTQGGTLERVRTAHALVQDGMAKTKACKKARIDTRTYDKYLSEIIEDWGVEPFYWEDDS